MSRTAWLLLLLEVMIFSAAYHAWSKQQWKETDLKPECYGERIQEVIIVP